MEEISHKSRSTKEDLTGQQFGRLTAKRIVTSLKKRRRKPWTAKSRMSFI